MKHFKVILVGLAVVSTALNSCVKEKDFPVTPAIEFKQYNEFGRDSADCIIKFKDGDGDIGVMEGDTVPDLRMKYLYFDTTTNSFLPLDNDLTNLGFDTLFSDYRVPNLTPNGQYKALDGEIKVKLRSTPIYDPTHFRVKWEITLKDRAGHISNTVTTNEIILP
jgi:hypothetical protein